MKLPLTGHDVTFKKYLTHGDVLEFDSIIFEGLKENESTAADMLENQEKQKAKLIEICVESIKNDKGVIVTTVDFEFVKSLMQTEFNELYEKCVEILKENNKKKDSPKTKKQPSSS